MKFRRAEGPIKPRPQLLMRWGIDGLLLGLVVFTPLAFGSVEAWAIGVIEWAALSVFLLWLLLHLWFPEPAQAPGEADGWLLRPLRRAGIAAASGAFLALVLLQLVPLPPLALRVVSPTAWKLYSRTLPNYGKPGGVDFNHIESWLLENAAEKGVAEEPLPWSAEPRPDLAFSSWRTVSMTPASTRRALGLLLAYLMLFVVAAERCRDPFFRRRLLWIVAFTGALVAMLGLAQETTWGDRLYGRIRPAYGGRPMGPFVNRNHFAGYLEMTLSVFAGLWIALLRRERDANPRRRGSTASASVDQKYIPQLFIVSLFLATGALALWKSGSRGGLIAVGATLLLFAALSLAGTSADSRRRKLVLAVAALSIAAGFAWKAHSLTRQESLELNLAPEPSFGMRLRIWQASLGMLRSFAGVGSGFGTYGFVIPLYQGGGYNHLWIYAHNDYVQLACETGAIGMTLFLLGFARFTRRALFPILANPLERGGAVLGCGAAILCLLVHSLVDFNLQIPSNGMLFVLLGAVLVSASRTGTPIRGGAEASPPPAPDPRRLKAATLAALGAWLVGALVVAQGVMARGWQNSATARFRSGGYKDAENDLRRALRVGASLPDLQADAGFLYLRALQNWETLGTSLEIEQDEVLARGRASFARAIDLNPVNTNPWSGLADLYLEARQVQLRTAVRDLSQLLEAPAGSSRLERLYMAVLRKMMKLEPSNPYFYASLGDFHVERSHRQEALNAYEQSVRLLPNLEEQPFLSGQEISPDILQAAIRGAEQALAQGSREVPEHRLRLDLSILYGKAGDWRAAIQHMERASALQPRRIWYHFRLGSLYFEAGELDRSRDIFLKYLDQASSGDEFPHILLAMIAERKGDKPGAVAYYRKALGANPESARVALDLGRVYESLGDTRNAGRYFELAADLRPNDVNVLLAVADYYARSAAAARAIPVLQKVVALRPNDDIYKQRLEQLRERAGLAR